MSIGYKLSVCVRVFNRDMEVYFVKGQPALDARTSQRVCDSVEGSRP